MNKIISFYNEDGISNSKEEYCEKERIPALMEIFPPRILDDYENKFSKDFLLIYNRLKKYKFTLILLKTINYLVMKYEILFSNKSSGL